MNSREKLDALIAKVADEKLQVALYYAVDEMIAEINYELNQEAQERDLVEE